MKPERRFWKPDVSQDVDDELILHLELRQRDLVERGLDPVEAREIAARQFGDVQSIAAACRNIDDRWYREQRRASMWMDLRQDVTYGLRVLRKSPGFVLAAVASLSIGIAATTAVFSMLNALLLRSLPGVTDSSRLAAIYTVAPRIPTGIATDESVYRRYREVLTPFSGIAGFARTSVAVGLGHEPFAASAVLVTDAYFDVLGTQPSAGGLIDASVYHQPVVVVSHEFAERHFGRADAAPGRAFAINGHPFQVAGVTPPRFVGATPGGLGGDPAQRPQLWIPLTMHRMVQQGTMRLINQQGEQASNQETVWLSLVGRLAPGVTLAAARAQAATVPPHAVGNPPTDARPLLAPVGRGPRERPWEMVAIVALMFSVPLIVLAIGCANTANLQLARASGREGEIAIRRSLGATRGRVVRQLLIESLIVALLAGVAGVAGTAVVARAFAEFVPVPVPVDWRVLAFALLAAAVTGIAFGMAPALGVTRGDLVAPLKDSTGAPAFRRSRLRHGLVMAQIALSLLLLVMAGLFTRTLQRLHGLDADRDMAHVAAASIDVALMKYTPEQSRALQEALLSRIEQVPGVVAAAIAQFAPFRGSDGLTYRRPEQTYPKNRPYEFSNGGAMLGRFIETAGLRIVRGRGFTDADRSGVPAVAVVSETLARHVAPSGGVIGRRLLVGDGRIPDTEVTIVGVTADTGLRLESSEDLAVRGRGRRIEGEVADAMFLPSPLTYDDPHFLLWVRTAGNPVDVMPHIRAIVRQLDPRLPILQIRTAEWWRAREMRELRWITNGLSAMGVLALLLAGAGLYAVMSYLVAGRRHEMAVRLALGATPRQLIALVAGDGVRLSVPGIIVGALLSALVAHLARTALVGVSPFDPVAFASVAAILLVVALVATLLPALRASKLDPLATLRRQ
jgi:predicted permease